MLTAVQCLALVARRHGVDTTPERLAHDYALTDEPASERVLRMAKDLGLKANLRKINWSKLNDVGDAFPVLCPLANGNWVLLVGMAEIDNQPAVKIIDPLAEGAQVIEVGRKAFENAWRKEIVLLKEDYSLSDSEQPFGFGWFIPELMRHKVVFVEVGVISLLMHVFALSVPIFFQITFDKVVGNQSIHTLYVLTGAVVAALTFNAIIEYLRGLLLLHGTSKVDVRLSTRTFSKLLSLPIDFFRQSSAGSLTKHMQQASSIREFLTGKLFMTGLDCLALFVYIPILFFYSGVLTAVVLGFGALIALITFAIKGSYKERLSDLYKAEGDRQSMLVETIGGMETVKALAIEPLKQEQWNQRAARTVAMHIGVGRISTLVSGLSKYLGQIMSVSILFIGVQLVFTGDLSVGAIVAFNMLAQRVSGPIIAAVGLVHEYQNAALSIRMLAQVMNRDAEQTKTGGLTPDFQGGIEFENVGFSYKKAPSPALNNISFEVKPDQFIGVVGRSGSGKSTITRLLQGLHTPNSGIIRIDGHDMRELDLAHLRMKIGVVLQESFLFSGTVRENISAACPDANFLEVVSASKLAGAEEFIEQLPQGYDTILEEGASNLSGGQKQRLAIARALLKKPRILILDEATSALDPESETIIQQNMDKIGEGRTTIAVSHRLSSLIDADRILVVDRGAIIASGTHGELLTSCPLYHQLWQQQNGGTSRKATA